MRRVDVDDRIDLAARASEPTRDRDSQILIWTSIDIALHSAPTAW